MVHDVTTGPERLRRNYPPAIEVGGLALDDVGVRRSDRVDKCLEQVADRHDTEQGTVIIDYGQVSIV